MASTGSKGIVWQNKLGLVKLERLRLDPIISLSLLAVITLVIYALAFVVPYGLLQWWTSPGGTIGKISQYAPAAGAQYLLSMVALFGLNLLALRLVVQHYHARMWYIIIGGAVAFSAVMLLLYPVGASDVFDYIMHARMQAFYGANPSLQLPTAFPNDPFYIYTGWKWLTSPYGPWWDTIAAGTAKLAGNGVIANVLAFKAIAILAYAATTVLIALTLRRQSGARALYGVTFFAWNPLIIYETAGNAHNDVLMILFAILAFYWLSRKRFTLGPMAVVGGAMVKFLPVVLLPSFLLTSLKQLRDGRERLGYILLTSGACGLIGYGTYLLFWRDADIGHLVNSRAAFFTTSLPSLLQVALEPRFGEELSVTVAKYAATALLALWVTWQFYVLYRSQDEDATEQAGVSILLFYLLVSCLWYQPWYTIGPLALAALLPDSPLARGTFLLSFAATCKSVLAEFVLFRDPNLGANHPLVELWLTLGVLGLPWLYFIWQWLWKRRFQRIPGSSQ